MTHELYVRTRLFWWRLKLFFLAFALCFFFCFISFFFIQIYSSHAIGPPALMNKHYLLLHKQTPLPANLISATTNIILFHIVVISSAKFHLFAFHYLLTLLAANEIARRDGNSDQQWIPASHRCCLGQCASEDQGINDPCPTALISGLQQDRHFPTALCN